MACSEKWDVHVSDFVVFWVLQIENCIEKPASCLRMEDRKMEEEMCMDEWQLVRT